MDTIQSSTFVDVQKILQLQADTVAQWHVGPIENNYSGLFETICQQHSFNYQLWHEEDIARCPESDDSRIAQVKRAIDRFNQQRNDWIERIDDELTDWLEANQIEPSENAKLNSETPGSVIDRLSIMSLRIYHLEEQLQRDDASETHLESVQRKLAVCFLQRDDLAQSLQELLDAIAAGQKRHRTYRQFKMYNDPSLNPYLYQAKQKAA